MNLDRTDPTSLAGMTATHASSSQSIEQGRSGMRHAFSFLGGTFSVFIFHLYLHLVIFDSFSSCSFQFGLSSIQESSIQIETVLKIQAQSGVSFFSSLPITHTSGVKGEVME